MSRTGLATVPGRIARGGGSLLAILSMLSAAAVAAETPSPTVMATAPVADQEQSIEAVDSALRGGRLVEAKALLDGLHAVDDGRLALLRAEWLLFSGRPADAASLLDGLPESERTTCRGAIALATAQLRLNRVEAGRTQLTGREGDCRDDPAYWRLFGQLELKAGHPASATAALRRAHALRPDDADAANDLAVALLADGLPAEAVDILSLIAPRRPGDAEARLNLDFANGMLGRAPSRADRDDDARWSQRLQSAGAGARRAGRIPLAEALYAQALIERPRHDERLWRQYEEATQGHD